MPSLRSKNHTDRSIQTVLRLGTAVLFAVGLPCVSGTDFAGVTVPGQLLVNNQGYSNYTVPLAVVPGSGGLTPSLQLSYGGVGTISYLGQGWSLSGLSTIYRGQQTIDIDGVSANPTGNPADALYLDGARLVLSNVTASGIATLKNVRADYSLVQAFHWSQPDQYFVVKTKAGLTLKLGRSPGSRAVANGAVNTWYLDEVSDSAGNFFTVTYKDISSTEKVPIYVDYTGNTRTGTAPYVRLTFNYAQAATTYVGYHYGIPQSRSSRLTTMVESVFGVERHRYAFTYKETKYWPGAELVSIDSIYPTGVVKGPRFEYRETAPNWQTVNGYASPISPGTAVDESNAVEMGDIDGRGAADLLYSYRLHGADTSLSFSGTSSGWQANTALALPVPLQTDSQPVIGRMLADVNGDGTLDLLIADSGVRRTFLRKGTAWVENAAFALPFDLAVNGKRVAVTRVIPAVVGVSPIRILWSNGAASGALIGSATRLGNASSLAPPQPFSFSGNSSVTAVLVDLDCDGSPELVYMGDGLPSGIPVVYERVGNRWVRSGAPALQLPPAVRGKVAGFGLVRLQNSSCKNLIVRLATGASVAISHSDGISISVLPSAAPPFDLPGELETSRVAFEDYDADGNAAAAGVDAQGKLICARFSSGQWQSCAQVPNTGVTFASVGRVFVGDFDGNQRLDVLILADGNQPDKARGLVFLGTSGGFQRGDGFFPQAVKLSLATDFYNVRFLDLNGDGLADILVLGDSKAGRRATAYLNTGSGWTEEPRYALPIDFGDAPILAEAFQLLDFTGDGAPDALLCVEGWNSPSNCHVLKNVCPQGPSSAVASCFADSGFPLFPAKTHSTDHGDLGVRFVDLDADGRIDVILGRQELDGTSVRRAWLWSGQNWAATNRLAPPVDFVTEDPAWGATPSQNADLAVRIGDLNGDRLPDLAINTPLPDGTPAASAIPCNQIRCVSTFLLTPGGWQRAGAFDAPVGPASRQTADQFWAVWADVNGDGLDDLLTFSFTNRESHAYLNTGRGLVENTSYAIPPAMFGDDKRDIAVRLLDANADGMPDLIRASRKQDGSLLRSAYLNSGSGWTPAEKEYAPDHALTDFSSGDLGSKLIDVDGNGNPDLLFGLDSAVGDTSNRVAIANLNQRAGLLLKVTDGLGSVSSLTYGSGLSAPTRQAPLSQESSDTIPGYPQIPLNAPVWLVIATKMDVAGRPSLTRRFTYGGFAMDVARGIPLGPAWRRITDDNARSSVETHFLRTLHLEGLVGSESTFDTSGLRSKTASAYADISIADCSVSGRQVCYDVVPSETLSTDFDSTSRPAYSSRQRYQYDLFGNVTRLMIEYFSPSGSGVERSTITENTFTNDLGRWYLGRLTRSRVTNQSNDSAPIVTESQFEYEAETGLVSSERANSQAPNSFKRIFERDLFGNVVATRLQSGALRRTLYAREFDPQGRFVARTCNALSHCESYQRRPADGLPTLIRNANRELTHIAYDDIGRTLHVDSGGSHVVIEYSDAGAANSGIARFKQVTRLNAGDPDITLFDGGGAQVRHSKPGFKGQRSIETARYDADGLLKERTEPAYEGQPVRRWLYQYDAFGRLVAVKAPNGFTTVYDTRGQSISKRNSDGPVATQEYSADHHVKKIVDALGRAITFHYDAAGRQDRIRLANGAEYIIRYDASGNKIEVRDPDRGLTRYTWNGFGELAEVHTPDGVAMHLEYDAVGRLVRRVTPDMVSEWRYDKGAHAIGQISEIHDNHGYVEKRVYGPRGRVSQVQYEVNGERLLEDFEYAPDGALLSYHAPNAVTTAYKYDKNGFVETVSLPKSGQTIWTAGNYAPDGRVIDARYGDNIRAITGVAPDTGAIDRLTLQSRGGPIDDVRYQRNDAGYVTSRKDVLAGKLDEFSYDAAGQLKGWKRNGAILESYEYDPFGNLTRSSRNGTIDYTNQAQFPHRATALHIAGKSLPIRYDSSGRIVSFGDASVQYASDGLPLRVSDPRQGETQLRRDPNGSVVYERTTRGLAEIEVLHVGRFERVHVRGIAWSLPSGEKFSYRNYLVTPSGVIGYVERTNWVYGRMRPTVTGEFLGAESARALGVSVHLRFIQTDLLGSPRVIADETGRVLERPEFNPWGARVDVANPGPENRIDSPTGFGGYGNTGIEDFLRSGPRMYSPMLGRFLQPDPLLAGPNSDLGADLNPYMFARNSPLRYADPSGFSWFGDLIDHVGGAVVGFIAGGPVGAIAGGIMGLHREGELVEQYWRPAVIIAAGVALTVATGGTLGPVVAAMLGGAVSGGLSSALYGGSTTDIIQGAIRGALIGAIGGAAGAVAAQAHAGIIGQLAIGGTAGGYTSLIEGGSFEQGFVFGALGAGLGVLARNYNLDRSIAGRVISRAVIGGTLATVEGGKFENGAAMAAFALAAEGAADTIARINNVDVRGLTKGEIESVKAMLIKAGEDPSIIKWEDVRVINGSWLEVDSGHAITPYGEIFMPPANQDTFKDYSGSKLFLHEMVHVYQYYRGDFVSARGLWEQGTGWVRDSYCTAGTQEFEASRTSGYTGHSCTSH